MNCRVDAIPWTYLPRHLPRTGQGPSEAVQVGGANRRAMLRRPRHLVAAALVCLAALPLLHAVPAPAVAPGEADRYEGQRVRVEGIVVEATRWSQSTRLIVAQHGHALPVLVEGDAQVQPGAWVTAAGRLERFRGELLLRVGSEHALVSGPAPRVARPDWSQLAAEPTKWSNRVIELNGTIEGRRFADGGIHVTTGDGPWPKRGAATVQGVVAYDAACFCYRMHAHAVTPWTS
jgi:hypothetical protein